jgi:hypothetical protein
MFPGLLMMIGTHLVAWRHAESADSQIAATIGLYISKLSISARDALALATTTRATLSRAPVALPALARAAMALPARARAWALASIKSLA